MVTTFASLLMGKQEQERHSQWKEQSRIGELITGLLSTCLKLVRKGVRHFHTTFLLACLRFIMHKSETYWLRDSHQKGNFWYASHWFSTHGPIWNSEAFPSM